MNTAPLHTRRSSHGMTLAEMAISMAVVTIVTVGLFNVFVQVLRSYNTTTLMRTAAVRASSGLERMVFGVGTNTSLREAPASSVSVTYSNSVDWTFSYTNNLCFKYTSAKNSITDQSGKLICTNVVSPTTISNLTNGCLITISVCESGGGRTVTNTMTTFVQYRN